MAIEAYKAKLCSPHQFSVDSGVGCLSVFSADVGAFIGINRKEIALSGASADSVLVKI